MAYSIADTTAGTEEIASIVRRALAEDLGRGDVTTDSIAPAGAPAHGQFIAKVAGVVAGWDVVAAVFAALDRHVVVQPIVHDGRDVRAGALIGTVNGPARALLSGERVALNFLQRNSVRALDISLELDTVPAQPGSTR